jgi:hypothetical protein
MAKIAGGSALSYVLCGRVLKRNALITMVVGCLLSLINQSGILFSDPFTVPLATKLSLNFLVPFVVSSLSSAINRESR